MFFTKNPAGSVLFPAVSQFNNYNSDLARDIDGAPDHPS